MTAPAGQSHRSGTGPFFGQSACAGISTLSENMDLSPSSPLRATVAPTLLASGLTLFAQSLVLAVVPASILWWPIYEQRGTGTLTIADFVMACLWLLAVPPYLLATSATADQRRAFLIHLTAMAPGVLAALSSVFWIGSDNISSEIFMHMKRFGLASAIPLAMTMCGSRQVLDWSQRVIWGCIALLTLSTLVPEIADAMPVRTRIEDIAGLGKRAIGLITNPNDLAYLMVCGAVVLLAIQLAQRRMTTPQLLWVAAGTAAAGFSLVGTGSRSGVLGAAAAAAFYVLKGAGKTRQKICLLLALSAAAVCAVQFSEVFQERMQSVYAEGTGEINISSRFDAQEMAVRAAFLNPLGVGYGNFAMVTKQLSRGKFVSEVDGSDSAYVDTLLGAGFLGLASLLTCFALCYRYVSPTCPPERRPLTVLQCGAIAMFVFGLATVSPIAVFVSPMFFFMIGVAGLIRRYPAPLTKVGQIFLSATKVSANPADKNVCPTGHSVVDWPHVVRNAGYPPPAAGRRP